MRARHFVQAAASGAIVALAVFAIRARDGIGFKGTSVELSSIVLCLVASAVAAYVTTRTWHWLPAPFIAGIVGVMIGGRLGPVGGAVGFVVGVAVTAIVIAQKTQGRLRRP